MFLGQHSLMVIKGNTFPWYGKDSSSILDGGSDLRVFAVVTQMVEYHVANVTVAGSNPVYCS